MDGSIIKKTQDSLGKIVKKPPLTEKLLGKPPFRFLHDIITSVIKSTGFMKGLFTSTESNSENVKDKDSKIAFLQKAIDMVCAVTGKSVSVRPQKIVAGQEPEKTNEFLQALATAINMKVDNEEYVQQVLGKKGGKDSSKEKPTSASKSSRSKDRDDERGSGNENKRRSKDSSDRRRPTSKESDRPGRKENGKESEREGSGKASRDRSGSGRGERIDGPDEENVENVEPDSKEGSQRARERNERNKEKERMKEESPEINGEKDENDNEEDPPARITRPSSAKGPRRRHRDEEEALERIRAEQEKKRKDDDDDDEMVNGTIGEGDLPPQVLASRKLARPSSARPAAPRIKRQEDGQDDGLGRIGSGKQQVANVIVDGNHSEDEDFMVEESGALSIEVDDRPKRNELEDDDGEHGGLVRKILETKKELEGGSQTAKAKTQDASRDKLSYINDATRRKEREMVQKEIVKLRTSIQTLTRSANPLGKIMDYVQEDLDSMQKELEVWKNENREHSLALKREQGITETSIEPLNVQLQELDQAISDQLDQIAAVKCNIHRNDEKVEKMLASVSKS